MQGNATARVTPPVLENYGDGYVCSVASTLHVMWASETFRTLIPRITAPSSEVGTQHLSQPGCLFPLVNDQRKPSHAH